MFALGRAAGRRLLVRAAPTQQPPAAATAAAAVALRGLASSAAAALEGYHKTSTGLVGLAVNPNAREALIAQQKALLDKIKKIPAEAEYRKVVESIANYRLKTAQEITDAAKLEEALDDGQLEEILQQGEDELKLIDEYAEWKFWEMEEVKAAFRD